jgi:hypothetical protein
MNGRRLRYDWGNTELLRACREEPEVEDNVSARSSSTVGSLRNARADDVPSSPDHAHSEKEVKERQSGVTATGREVVKITEEHARPAEGEGLASASAANGHCPHCHKAITITLQAVPSFEAHPPPSSPPDFDANDTTLVFVDEAEVEGAGWMEKTDTIVATPDGSFTTTLGKRLKAPAGFDLQEYMKRRRGDSPGY